MRYRAYLDESVAGHRWVSPAATVHTWDPGLVGCRNAVGSLLLMIDVAP